MKTLTEDAKWNAVLDKDTRADGSFFYSVKTTGIYCLPSCSSRPALRENVTFHESAEAAERAGFRPCKRCRPRGPKLAEEQATAVAKACKLMAEADSAPNLETLAKTAGMSSFHFHRVFKSITGVTPRNYAAALRSKRVREKLPRSASVTDAIYDAGFNSSGRFYAKSNETLGMTPTDFRSGGKGASIRFAFGDSTLGAVLVAASERGICSISLGDQRQELQEDLQKRFPNAELVCADKEFARTVAAVVGLVEAPNGSFNLPLDIRGTAFQQKVWQALQKIPAGETMSYTELARRIGAPKAVRAAASACASNKLAIAIPCHRVVGASGGLTGYRWGIGRKKKLLEREGALSKKGAKSPKQNNEPLTNRR